MLGIADVIIDTYAMESAILRTRKLVASDAAVSCYLDMTRVFCSDAIQRIEATVNNTLSAMADGNPLDPLLAAQPQLTMLPPMNTVAARLRIAKALVEADRWIY